MAEDNRTQELMR